MTFMMATNTGVSNSSEVKPAMQSSPSSSARPSDPNCTESEKPTKMKRVYRFFAYTESDSKTEDEDEDGDDDEDDQSSSNNFPFWPSKPLSYIYDECIAAIQGKAVPARTDSAMTCRSIVRSIRRHPEFASNPDVVALCSRTKSDYPEHSGTRSARLIMSNVISDEMYDPQCQPYCIWNPDIAREDTYRELAERYPSMRY